MHKTDYAHDIRHVVQKVQVWWHLRKYGAISGDWNSSLASSSWFTSPYLTTIRGLVLKGTFAFVITVRYYGAHLPACLFLKGSNSQSWSIRSTCPWTSNMTPKTEKRVPETLHADIVVRQTDENHYGRHDTGSVPRTSMSPNPQAAESCY